MLPRAFMFSLFLYYVLSNTVKIAEKCWMKHDRKQWLSIWSTIWQFGWSVPSPRLATCTMKHGSDVLILRKFTQVYCYKFISNLPSSIVNGPVWLVMSVFTYPGWTAFTMRSSRGSESNARCCIKVRALTPTFDAWYDDLGQPSAWEFPAFAALKAHANKEISYL
jgi:hypothetical protein